MRVRYLSCKTAAVVCMAILAMSACHTAERAMMDKTGSQSTSDAQRAGFSKAMTGEEIKQLLIGNTTKYQITRGGRPVTVWVYHKDETTAVLTSDEATGNNLVRNWQVTPDGKYCRETRRVGLACWSNVRLNGNVLRMDSTGPLRNRADELVQGNPKNL